MFWYFKLPYSIVFLKPANQNKTRIFLGLSKHHLNIGSQVIEETFFTCQQTKMYHAMWQSYLLSDWNEMRN